MKKLNIVLLKPSKYMPDGYVQRFESGFMPNATLSHIASLTPDIYNGYEISVHFVDEYVRTDLKYLDLLFKNRDALTLLALVGVQSHQFQRAIDLASFAKSNGVENVIIGGPHPMTCDTKILQECGVSFSLSEAEVVWGDIINDATSGGLRPTYGLGQRWATEIPSVEFRPPPRDEVERHWVPMVGYYPVRGCPFTCNFCSVIKIAGRRVRSPSIDSILAALKTIKKSGIDLVMFTSDNFNKFPLANELLQRMIKEQVGIRFFFQADTQIVNQPELVDLIGRAGGLEMFLGVESFDTAVLKKMRKQHNKPNTYNEIIRLCKEAGIRAHFSNIIGTLDQDEAGVMDHLNELKSLGPEFASFYIMTPIPGTEQYKEYLENGLIYEKNLDRFDSYTPTFSHEHFDPARLNDSLFWAYEDFYKHSMKKYRGLIDSATRNYMVFCRWSAANRMHPMSSGGGAKFLDQVADYEPVRRQVFGIGGLLPLPDNLELSAGDQEINRKVNWKLAST